MKETGSAEMGLDGDVLATPKTVTTGGPWQTVVRCRLQLREVKVQWWINGPGGGFAGYMECGVAERPRFERPQDAWAADTERAGGGMASR